MKVIQEDHMDACLFYDNLAGGPENSKSCKCKTFYGSSPQFLSSFIRKRQGIATPEDIITLINITISVKLNEYLNNF